MTETDSSRLLSASIALGASLLESVDEASILRSVMRVGCDVLDADGCFFMPFDEFAPSLPALEFGRTPPLEAGTLAQPAQRQNCKICETRQAGRECHLLHRGTSSTFIHCIPLRSRGRQTGLFSFVFSSEPRVDSAVERFLAEAARLADTALDGLERGRLSQSLRYSPTPTELADVESALPQVEYRAILGERARLAREIHDGLAQTLAYLKIEIGRAESMLEKGKSEQAARILKDSSRTLGDAYLDARQAIENLRRAPDGRLETWLQQVAEDFEVLSGVPVETNLNLASTVSANAQAQLIRIVQEALTNIRKHAQAGRVCIEAREENGEAVIEVTDNGRGFSPSDSITANRFGLRGMRERAESIGAEFQIVSHPKSGTTIRVSVPLLEGVKP